MEIKIPDTVGSGRYRSASKYFLNNELNIGIIPMTNPNGIANRTAMRYPEIFSDTVYHMLSNKWYFENKSGMMDTTFTGLGRMPGLMISPVNVTRYHIVTRNMAPIDPIILPSFFEISPPGLKYFFI